MQAIEELEKAVKHLMNARHRIEQGAWSGAAHKAHAEIIYATNSTRHALELLKQEKEE